MTTEVRPCTIVRNCFRCGNEFESDGGNRICQACRPKELRKRALKPNLTLREKQVVSLVCKAKLNKEIASELHLSVGTIKEYMNGIFRKLGVASRTELAILALSHSIESSKNGTIEPRTTAIKAPHKGPSLVDTESAA